MIPGIGVVSLCLWLVLHDGSLVCLGGEKVLQIQKLFSACVLGCACSFLVGCGSDGPQVVPVQGTVNFKGQPIGKINVLFVPDQGSKGMMAEGTTDESGKFKLQTKDPGDGAMVGSYSVAFKYVPDEVPMMPGMAGAKKVVSPIPEKYGDVNKSGHKATVDSDKSKNTFTFDLQ